MQHYKHYLVALLGGLVLWASWPTSPLTLLIFIGFLPLLWLEEVVPSGKKFFKLTYLYLFTWNVATTWWIYNASFAGAVLAIILNSLIMCVPWLLMRPVKKGFGATAAYVALVAFWISFEYMHHRWELSWPWLTLGNVFAMHPGWIQWYQYTGSSGGSLWVLSINLLLYGAWRAYRKHGVLKKLVPAAVAVVLLLAVPFILSKNIMQQNEDLLAAPKNASKNVVVVQPNVDPYNEKFIAGTQEAQIQNLISLSEQQIDSSTALVVWPETSVPVGVWEDQIQENSYYALIWNFLQRHPHLSLLSGIDSYKNYGGDKNNATTTARFDKDQNYYYDAFNTAAILRPDRTVQLYHKAKLVPGVETLPSSLLWLGKVFESFGGISGTLGSDKQRVVFRDNQHYFNAAPIICYESIYADYVTEYVRKGANLLTIITNDGWWFDTQGYRQHMAYARLRAIETRRWIARSANTGISCFIDPLGNIHQPQPWDTKASIKKNIEPLEAQTFFVRHGDYLSRIINVVSLVFLLLLLILALRKRLQPK